MSEHVYLREVETADLAEFFEHQRDPVASQMAAFPPRGREDFMTHWTKILADPHVVARTIVVAGKVAGNLLCWENAGDLLVGYWLGSNFWGRGIAAQALVAFVSLIPARPLAARVAKSNLASIRVLEKCGFRVTGEGNTAAPTGGEPVDELLYSLGD